MAARLRVSGDDALPFLQGQFTQDLVAPGNGSASYGLWLTQKGKVLADSHVLRISEREFCVFSVGCAGEVIRQRLESYIVADDVAVEELPGKGEAATFLGEESTRWLGEALAGGLPPPGRFVAWDGRFVFSGRRGVHPSFECVGPPLSFVPTSGGGARELDVETLERARILAGIPRVPEDIGPGDLPNEGKLDAQAISYVKGCYLGQEVMARLKSLGQVRRMLMRVRGTTRAAPVAPCALFQKEKRVGELRTAVADGKDGIIGLALLNLTSLDAAQPLAFAPGGAAELNVSEAVET